MPKEKTEETENKKKEGVTIKIPKMNVWMITTIVLAIVLVVVLVKGQGITGKVVASVGAQDAANKAVDYINKYLLQGQGNATIVSVKEDNGLYYAKLNIAGKQYDTYMTTDGKLLFPSVIDISQTPQTATTTTVKTMTCADITKADKPTLEAFVVSNCPYGLQMQRALAPVAKILGSNIVVKYIGSIANGKITSMHGDNEAQENLRQICIREEQNAKYWDYVNCYIQKGDTNTCLTTAKIDNTKLNSCMTDAKKGIAYAQKDFDAADKYQVSGSPTLFLNGEKVSEFDFGGRSADALKTLICCGFNKQPTVCTQKLSTDQAATSFSLTYSTASGSTAATAAGCAT
jgi:glutaredoxin